MTCTSLRDAACDLALDILGGDERAAALEHLASCASCRQDVALLTDAVEELLVLAPEIEPSAGFEEGVVARIETLAAPEPASGAHKRSRSTARRVVAAAAVVGVAVAIVVAGVVVTTQTDAPEAAALTADMRAGTGQVVGDVSLAGDPASLVLTIPEWVGLVHGYGATIDAPYWLAVRTDDGSRRLYRLPPAEEHPWNVDLDTDPGAVVAVSIVDNGGAVWCTARFPV